MARSIHHNRSLRLWKQRGLEYWDEEQLFRKRRIKKSIKRKRRTISFSVPPPVTSENIPIKIIEELPHLFYAVTVGDIRTVLDALPPGTLNGLTRICMESGTRYINRLDVDDYVLDPYLQRKSVELYPGIFSPVIGGMYDRIRSQIKLYGFVLVDPELDPDVMLISLKIFALNSLLHEIAHHQDQTQRIARGRWLMDDYDKVEKYAEDLAQRWTEKYAYPYLSARYGPGNS